MMTIAVVFLLQATPRMVGDDRNDPSLTTPTWRVLQDASRERKGIFHNNNKQGSQLGNLDLVQFVVNCCLFQSRGMVFLFKFALNPFNNRGQSILMPAKCEITILNSTRLSRSVSHARKLLAGFEGGWVVHHLPSVVVVKLTASLFINLYL